MAQCVWLVDDDPLVTKLTKARLGTLGADVRTFPSGNAALAAWMQWEEDHPMAVLMDLNMPGSSGLESGRMLRDTGFTGLLVLHTATSSGEAGDIAEFGFDTLLFKPAGKDDLKVILQAASARPRRRSA